MACSPDASMKAAQAHDSVYKTQLQATHLLIPSNASAAQLQEKAIVQNPTRGITMSHCHTHKNQHNWPRHTPCNWKSR